MKTIAELKADAEAATAAQAEATRLERETAEETKRAAEREKYAAARKATHDKWLPIFEAVAAELKAKHNVEMVVKPLTDFTSFSNEPKAVLPAGTYLDVHNGKLRVASTGNGGAYYSRRGDGTFNVAKIAESIAEKIEARAVQDKRNAAQQSATQQSAALADKVRNEFGLEKYDSKAEISGSQYNGDKVNIKITRALTEDEARKFLAALQTAGLL